MKQLIDAVVRPTGGNSSHNRKISDITSLAVSTFPYAYNATNTEISLCHLYPMGLNTIVRTLAFTVESGVSASPKIGEACWECYAVSGMGTLGSISYVNGVGLVLEGLYARWRLVPTNDMTPQSIGIKCDGLTTGQVANLNNLIKACSASNAKIEGSGTLLINNGEKIVVDDAFLNLENLQILANTGFSGPIMECSGGNKTTDASAITAHVHGTPLGSWGMIDNGNGTLSWENVNLNTTGFVIKNDNTGNSRYILHPAYCGKGVQVEGDSEKINVEIYAVGCDEALAEVHTGGGSPDTNKFTISGQRVRRLFTSGDDDTSRVDFNFEAAIDLGLNITLSDGAVVPDPRVLVKNGKSSSFSGEHRAHNGRLYYLVDRDGANAADGTDATHFNNLRFQDNVYGTLAHLRRVQKLTGRIFARHVHNGRLNYNEAGAAGEGTIPCPSIWIGQVFSGDFGVTITDCGAREGIRIGDATYNLYPVDWCMGRNTVIMRGFSPRLKTYPTTRNAVVFEKVVGGEYPFDQIEGNIRLEAGCQGPRIEVPAYWIKRYSLSADAAAVATLMVKGSLKSTDIFFKNWLSNNITIIVESLSDFGGARGVYSNGKWIIGAPINGTENQFGSLTSDLNLRFKTKGLIAFDGTRLRVASGPASTDPWTYFDGSNSVIPSLQAATSALLGRMSVQPSTFLRNVYDRLYFDLSEAGLLTTNKIIMLYFLGTEDESQALLNLMGNSYNLTKNGSPIWQANYGFTGTGVNTDYLATGFNAIVNPETMGQNNAHLGVVALTASSVGDMMGSVNGRFKIRAAGGGSNRYGVSTSSNPGWTSVESFPRHVMGNRVVNTEHTGWDNGNLVSTFANSSNGLPDEVRLLQSLNVATTGQIFGAHLGTGLNSTEISNLYKALMTACQTTVR